MDRFRFDALCNEFPFLIETLTRRYPDVLDAITHCDSIKIKRITAELLNSKPQHYRWVGSLVDKDETEEAIFVLRGKEGEMYGDIIYNAVLSEGESGSNYAHRETYREEGESVLNSIYRHGVAGMLAFIVWVEAGYNVVEHHSQSNWSVTIYKPAKDFTLSQAIEKAKDVATSQVRAEANF